MARSVTPDANDEVTFTERVIDAKGDALTLEFAELDTIDGIEQTGGGRNPSWLTVSEQQNTLANGASEILVELTLDATQVSMATYGFILRVNDGALGRTRTVTFSVRPPASAPSNIWLFNSDGTLERFNPTNGNEQSSISISDYGNVCATGLEQGAVAIGCNNRIEAYDETDSQIWVNDQVAGDIRQIIQSTDAFIYAFSRDANRIYKLNRSGTLLGTIIEGIDYNPPERIIPLENGNLVVAHTDEYFNVYDQQGNLVRSSGAFNRITYVSGENGGSNYAFCNDEETVKLDENFNIEWRSNFGYGGSLGFIHDATVYHRPTGHVVSTYGNNSKRIVFFNEEGDPYHDMSTEIGQYGGSTDLLQGEGGDIYHSYTLEFSGGLESYSIDGTRRWRVSAPIDGNSLAVPRWLG